MYNIRNSSVMKSDLYRVIDDFSTVLKQSTFLPHPTTELIDERVLAALPGPVFTTTVPLPSWNYLSLETYRSENGVAGVILGDHSATKSILSKWATYSFT
jgi:hypothetical protein